MAEGSIVSEWLRSLGLGHYADSFVDNGYDDLEICKQIGEPDLDAIGVAPGPHRDVLRRAVRRLVEEGGTAVYFTLEERKDSSSDDGSPVHRRATRHRHKPCWHADDEPGPVRGPLRYLDEYEEGKAELGRYPKMQLKNMVKEKLIRDGIRLSAQPYSNPDGSRGHLESLATKYADDLNTHYKDVLARLEEIRKRRVAIDFPPLPPQGDSLSLKATRNFKPGKYSPSSCLSDNEEESIYCLHEVTPTCLPGAPSYSSKEPLRPPRYRCLSPRSQFFYEPCPFPALDRNCADSSFDQSKKKSAFCRLFRSLGSKKDREKVSPRHKCAKQHHQLNVKYLAEGSRLQIGDIATASEDDQVRLLLQLVKDGFLSLENKSERECHK